MKATRVHRIYYRITPLAGGRLGVLSQEGYRE